MGFGALRDGQGLEGWGKALKVSFHLSWSWVSLLGAVAVVPDRGSLARREGPSESGRTPPEPDCPEDGGGSWTLTPAFSVWVSLRALQVGNGPQGGDRLVFVLDEASVWEAPGLVQVWAWVSSRRRKGRYLGSLKTV